MPNSSPITEKCSQKRKLYTISIIFCFFVLIIFINFNLHIEHGISIARSRIFLNFSTSITATTTAKFSSSVDQIVQSSATNTTSTRSITAESIAHDQNDYYKSATLPIAVDSREPIHTFNSSSSVVTSFLAPLTRFEAPIQAPLPSPPQSSTTDVPKSKNQDNRTAGKEEKTRKTKAKSCNIFEGRWVYKPTESPMYRAEQCPFLEVQNSCRKNGRSDSDYEKWSWEPKDCQIPLFNGKDLLERLRGKRVILVGDSLNRNQWFSLACLIYTSIPRSQSLVKLSLTIKVLKVKDYDFTLEYYWSPFLLYIDYRHKSGRRILHLDKLDPLSRKWLGADVMVFNSAHWWSHNPQKWDVINYKGKLIEDMKKEQAYELGLSTWSTWLTQNLNPNKTIVFFRSVSPQHKFDQWCYNATKPIIDDSFVNNYPNSMLKVMKRGIGANGPRSPVPDRFPIRYLNITWLSGYRRDAHSSLYSKKLSEQKSWMVGKKDIRTVAKEHADCSHWCLPGVPDTWNRLIYVSLFFQNETIK